MAPSPSDTAGIERLVRTVRSDAEQRKRLVCNACFLSALVTLHPDVVAKPKGERRWRREELDALATHTAGRIDDADQVHVIVGVDDLSVNIRYMKGSLVYLRAETNPPLRCMMYSSLPPPHGEEETLARAADATNDDDAEGGAKGDMPAGPAKVLDASDASPDLVRAVLRCLDEDPSSTSDDCVADDPDSVATWRSKRVKDTLTETYGTYWHVRRVRRMIARPTTRTRLPRGGPSASRTPSPRRTVPTGTSSTTPSRSAPRCQSPSPGVRCFAFGANTRIWCGDTRRAGSRCSIFSSGRCGWICRG